jgi:hypothetical protein
MASLHTNWEVLRLPAEKKCHNCKQMLPANTLCMQRTGNPPNNQVSAFHLTTCMSSQVSRMIFSAGVHNLKGADALDEGEIAIVENALTNAAGL